MNLNFVDGCLYSLNKWRLADVIKLKVVVFTEVVEDAIDILPQKYVVEQVQRDFRKS